MPANDRSSAQAADPNRARGTGHRAMQDPPQRLDPFASAAAIRDQVEVLREDAARLVDIGRAARTGLEWSLRGRLERNPYAVLASAAGIGAVLGGALTPTMVLALTSAAIRITAATAMRGALVQALGAGIGRAAGNGEQTSRGNHEPTSENNP